jgi:hypothetical protein
MKVSVKAEIWLYPANAAWHFISVPAATSANIKKQFADYHRGWGSLPVKVKLGKTSWQTSIFWDSKRKSYLLPLKSAVRKAEGIGEGDSVNLQLTVFG